jgi:hypothetical protein
LGVPFAFLTAIIFGDGAEAVIHIALGASFLLIALSVFDLGLPAWFNLAAGPAIGMLALIFLLQGVSDLTRAPALRHFAFDLVGQRLEKLLGYAFLLWCLGVLWRSSSGWTRVFGALVFALIVGVELYGLWTNAGGGEAPGVLKLLYLPLFLWLLLESIKPSMRADSSTAMQGSERDAT